MLIMPLGSKLATPRGLIVSIDLLWENIQTSIQVNLIITLSLGSIETDRVISEPCYNEVIYYRHIAK